MRFRSDLQQAQRIINRISQILAVNDLDQFNADNVVRNLAEGIFNDLEHLIDMRQLIISLNNEGRIITATRYQGEPDELLADRVRLCMDSSPAYITVSGGLRSTVSAS